MSRYTDLRKGFAQMRANTAESALYDVLRAVFRNEYSLTPSIIPDVFVLKAPLLQANNIDKIHIVIDNDRTAVMIPTYSEDMFFLDATNPITFLLKRQVAHCNLNIINERIRLRDNLIIAAASSIKKQNLQK